MGIINFEAIRDVEFSLRSHGIPDGIVKMDMIKIAYGLLDDFCNLPVPEFISEEDEEFNSYKENMADIFKLFTVVGLGFHEMKPYFDKVPKLKLISLALELARP